MRVKRRQAVASLSKGIIFIFWRKILPLRNLKASFMVQGEFILPLL